MLTDVSQGANGRDKRKFRLMSGDCKMSAKQASKIASLNGCHRAMVNMAQFRNFQCIATLARNGSPSAHSPFLIFDSICVAAMRGEMSVRVQRDARQSLARLALVRRIGTKMI
jgi:hypothetical protein